MGLPDRQILLFAFVMENVEVQISECVHAHMNVCTHSRTCFTEPLLFNAICSLRLHIQGIKTKINLNKDKFSWYN